MSTGSSNEPTQLTIDNAAYEATAGTMQDGEKLLDQIEYILYF